MTFMTLTEIDNLSPPPNFLLDPILKEQAILFHKVLSLGVKEIRPIEKALDRVFQNPTAKLINDGLDSKVLRFDHIKDETLRPSYLFWGSGDDDYNDRAWTHGTHSFYYYKNMIKTKSGNSIIDRHRAKNLGYLLNLYQIRRKNMKFRKYLFINGIYSMGDVIDYFKKSRYSFDKTTAALRAY